MEKLKPKQETDVSHLSTDEVNELVQKTREALDSIDENSLGYKLAQKTHEVAKTEQEKRQSSAQN